MNSAPMCRYIIGFNPLADFHGWSQSMRRQMLLSSIVGHLSLLSQKYPKKAAGPVATRTRKYIARLRRLAA